MFWQKASKGSRHVLVADDSPGDLKLLKEALVKVGYRVTVACDGGQAQIMAINKEPELVILDVTMPMKSGYAVSQFLKSYPKTCNVPVILVSGRRTRAEDIDLGYKSGAAFYFTKPLDLSQVLEAVEGLLHSRVAAQASQVVSVSAVERSTT